MQVYNCGLVVPARDYIEWVAGIDLEIAVNQCDSMVVIAFAVDIVVQTHWEHIYFDLLPLVHIHLMAVYTMATMGYLLDCLVIHWVFLHFPLNRVEMVVVLFHRLVRQVVSLLMAIHQGLVDYETVIHCWA